MRSPMVSIPGAAGAAIAAALSAMAMHAGEMIIIVKKVRVAGGGYTYAIEQDKPQPPGFR